MRDIYLGRQPIYNRKLSLEAYELLYRHAAVDSARIDDADTATSQVILNVVSEIGLPNLVEQRLAFVNVARRFVVDGGLKSVQHPQLVFEIAAGEALEPGLLGALRALRAQGRRFALDNYVDTPGNRALLEVADFVKLDMLSTAPEELARLAGECKGLGIRLMATRIETPEAVDACLEAGVDYLQGYHFSQPRLLKFAAMPTNQAAILQLIGALNDPDARLEDIERMVAQDVSLSYKLLRHLNSAYFNLPNRVDSIRHAVVLLGLDHLKAWATLISLAQLDGRGSDMAQSALVRGFMCRGLAQALDIERPEVSFTVGLLSVLDRLTRMPLEQVIATLPLAEDVAAALTRHEGEHGRLLACTLAYERGDWAAVDASGIGGEAASTAYFAALQQAYQATRTLF